MKYVLIASLLLLAVPAISFAKKDSTKSSKYIYRGSQLLIGHGYSPTGMIFDGNGTGSTRTYELGQYTGAWFVNYRFHKSRKKSYGLTAAYENESGVWNKITVVSNPTRNHPYQRDYNSTFLGHYKKQFFTLSPEITVTYFGFHKGFVRVYGTLGIGISYRNEIDTYDTGYYLSNYANGVNKLGNSLVLTDSHFQFNMYVSFLGIHVGRKLGCFIESGLGYKGLLNIGTSYKF